MGKIHLTGVKAVDEPPSLVDLRNRTTAMLPRAELPAMILEFMAWVPELAEAFTGSVGRPVAAEGPADLDRGLPDGALAERGVPADRQEGRGAAGALKVVARLPELLPARDVELGECAAGRDATCRWRRRWGEGLVAAVDGMRFVVPVPAAFARPNRKYFGSKRGMTWLNAMNDRGMGRGAKVVSGTIRDSLHMVDVIFGLDGGDLPEIVVSDTGSYSDLVFGLLELLGISYRPALADLPDQKGWRINPDADYGP